MLVCVLRVCARCAFCVFVLWCAVLCRYVWCWCWCWCAMCGVWCLWCVVCGHAENPLCVGSKRLRVYRQNARMFNTCARFAGTHEGVLNPHTETFLNLHKGGLSLSLLSSPLLLSSFFFLSSVVLFLVLFLCSPPSALCSLLFLFFSTVH